MPDMIPLPTVLTTIRIGKFTIYAYAYRTLTHSECELVKQQYLRQYNRKSIPAKGYVKILTQFGSNPEAF